MSNELKQKVELATKYIFELGGVALLHHIAGLTIATILDDNDDYVEMTVIQKDGLPKIIRIETITKD